MLKTATAHRDSLSKRLEQWSFYEPMSGCQIWFGCVNQLNGRPVIRTNSKNKLAYRCAWELEFGEIPGKLLVCHKCDNKLCINVKHLFLGTHQENSNDAILKGRTSRGVKHPWAKLSEADVHKIRELYAAGLYQKDIGKLYNVTQANVFEITSRKTWSHI